MTRVFSGIQPTGSVHLGNLLGALRHWVADQHDGDVAVLRGRPARPHRPPGPGRAARPRRCELAQMLLAVGHRSRRSARCSSRATSPSTPSWPGSWSARRPTASCSRMTQFKDKSQSGRVRVGRAVHLPGAHGRRHPALRHRPGAGRRRPAPAPRADPRPRHPVQQPLRRHVRRARGRHPAGRRPGDGPPAPRPARCPSPTDSPQGTILVLDDLDAVAKKIKRAVTDTDNEVRFDPDDQARACRTCCRSSARCTGRTTESSWPTATSQYGPLKADTAEAVVEVLGPIQARYAELHRRPGDGTAASSPEGAGQGRPRRGHPGPRPARLGLLPPADGEPALAGERPRRVTGTLDLGGQSSSAALRASPMSRSDRPLVLGEVVLAGPGHGERVAAGHAEQVAAELGCCR